MSGLETMQIWDKVYKTDPAATKQASVNGQKITSISGQHMIKRATEVFGPVGIGWGWTVVEERFDEGGQIRNDKGEVIGNELGHTIRIKLWYEMDGKRGEVEQYGCTPFVYRSKWGATTDTEAPKKSLTDAVKKALAMLGFSADIFLGMFDDQDYVAERQAEVQLEKTEDKEAELERQKQERIEWLKKAVETMSGAVALHELNKLHASYVRSASRRNEQAFVTRLARSFEERKAQLEQQENAA
jgi:hypothetical protein